MGANEEGGKETEGKAKGAKGTKATGAQDSRETGRKGDMLMGEREMDNTLPDDRTECEGMNPMHELL